LPFESPLSVDVRITTKNWMLRMGKLFQQICALPI
jgi:hypothetical protein